MISGVRGKLIYQDENHVELDTGTVVYEIFVPATMFVELSELGKEVFLYTHMAVKEDDMSLYGFLTREELKLFKQLITVSGIGPKGALSILSYLTPEKLILAILSKDVKAISKAQGIGAKSAEKLCIELRDKVTAPFTEVPDSRISVSVSGTHLSEAKQDAIVALTELGFTDSDAFKAVASLPDDLDSGKLLNLALKTIGK